VLDVFVTEPCLQAPGVVALVRQGVTRRMPQHVGMGFEPPLYFGPGVVTLA